MTSTIPLAILQVIGKATETRSFVVRTEHGDHACDMKCYPSNDHDYCPTTTTTTITSTRLILLYSCYDYHYYSCYFEYYDCDCDHNDS